MMQQHLTFVEKSLLKIKIIKNLETIVITQENIGGAAHSIYNLIFNVPN